MPQQFFFTQLTPGTTGLPPPLSDRSEESPGCSASSPSACCGWCPSLFAVSFLAFVLIQLPPGDFVTSYVATLAASNEIVDQNAAAALRERFGLNDPMLVQYAKWISGIITRGDFGLSFEWQQPVSDLIWERMALTLVLTLATLIATWAIALPIGVYSAVRKYSIGDYIVTIISFVGLAIPSFLLALVLMYVAAIEFGQDVSGLFSPAVRERAVEHRQDRRPAAASVDPGADPGGLRAPPA